jgi:hypothetical protein
MKQTLGTLSSQDITQKLASSGLNLRTPPFDCRIYTTIPDVNEGLQLLYSDYPVSNDAPYNDYHITLRQPASLRRFIRPQVLFDFDGQQPFFPLPYSQAFPMFEWGLNWCVSNHVNTYLVLHSAVVAKNDMAIILPGEPGAGKSTLCAALVQSGFRLLSDELTLIFNNGESVMPIPRPVSLKNASIDVIKGFAPDAVFNKSALDTLKGTVAHMKPPKSSVEQADTPATTRFVIFPRYQPAASTSLSTLSKTTSMMRLVEQSFNYHILGETGFNWLCNLVDRSDCYAFEYSNLDEAIRTFEDLF